MKKTPSIRQLIDKARVARAEHRERHRPSGFGIAISDSIRFLDASAWDEVTRPATVFIRRPYLTALEDNCAANVQPRYALLFRGRRPVAAVVAQIATLDGKGLVKPQPEEEDDDDLDLGTVIRKAGHKALSRVQPRVLVCGNLFSWGAHGTAFAEGEDAASLWPAVAEALYRIRRAERLSGQTDYVLVKDLSPERESEVAALRRFSYRPVETEPDMVVPLQAGWKCYDDYLASLNAKYRKASAKLAREVTAAGYMVERLADMEPSMGVLDALYRQVVAHAPVRTATFPASYLPALARALGEEFSCTVIRRGDEIAGFVTTLKDRETAVGYYMGFDYATNERVPVYLRLLQACVEEGIRFGCTRLSLGRTALEPKSRVGGQPVRTVIWLRHRVPIVNAVVSQFLHLVPHEVPPQRSPFKDAPPESRTD